MNTTLKLPPGPPASADRQLSNSLRRIAAAVMRGEVCSTDLYFLRQMVRVFDAPVPVDAPVESEDK
jgi:hypothetical protein